MLDATHVEIPFVDRSCVLKEVLAHHTEFHTDLFASLTTGEPSCRLREFGITECHKVSDGQWLVKNELNSWYSVTLDKDSTRIIRPYLFRPLSTQHEIEHLMNEAERFAK
jgi:hypothetical protein